MKGKCLTAEEAPAGDDFERKFWCDENSGCGCWVKKGDQGWVDVQGVPEKRGNNKTYIINVVLESY